MSLAWRKSITYPGRSYKLSEFVGIMIGDGSITTYQSSITLNSETDKEYALYIEKLIFNLFNISSGRSQRKNADCLIINTSSVECSEYLQKIGLPLGNKLRSHIDIPSWIKKEDTFMKACIRGACDTDGSIYEETHVIKG